MTRRQEALLEVYVTGKALIASLDEYQEVLDKFRDVLRPERAEALQTHIDDRRMAAELSTIEAMARLSKKT